jgi:shikimate kinase
MRCPTICFLSGASGVGKSTIVAELENQNRFSGCVYLHFDAIGVPSFEEMIQQAGSGEKWQEFATHRWIEKIMMDYGDRSMVVIEGQTNLEFIEAACHQFKVPNYRIILIDCAWETSKERLLYERHQPELVNQGMESWTAFLRQQAIAKQLPIVDTSQQSLAQSVESVSRILRRAIA